MDGQLVTIWSESQNERLRVFLTVTHKLKKNIYDAVYIGIRNLARDYGDPPNWGWANGKLGGYVPAAYTKWGKVNWQPRGHDCGWMMPNGDWLYDSCERPRFFVCDLPLL